MAAHRIVALGGNRTHLEGYSREFAADPRCEIVAVADENGISEYRNGLNRLLAAELKVPYLSLSEALSIPDVDIVISCVDIERRARVHQMYGNNVDDSASVVFSQRSSPLPNAKSYYEEAVSLLRMI